MPQIPIDIQLPDGSRFNGNVFQHGSKKTMRRMSHVIFAMMNKPEISIESSLNNLREKAKTREVESQPWIDKLQNAIETNRFTRFKVNTPDSFWVEYPDKYNLWLSEDNQNREINGYAPLSEARRSKYWLSKWDESWIRDQFKQAIKREKERATFERKLLGKRKVRLYETDQYLKNNFSKWIAVLASTSYKEISPKEVLYMIPPINKDISAEHFYSDPHSAFKWLGTIDMNDPECSVWKITPNIVFRENYKKSTNKNQLNAEIKSTEKKSANTRDFSVNLTIKNADVKNPIGILSEALKSAGVDFSVSSVKNIES
jgi:hypothetical protein